MGASALGGNVAGSEPGQTIVTANGVTIIGAGNLPATVPTAASNAYSRNISALLLHMVRDGALAIDLDRRDPGRAWSSPTAARSSSRPPRPCCSPRAREAPMSTALVTDLTIFVLALLVGIEVIGKVPATLHTPLMSAANSIHGIVLAGALLIGVTARQRGRLHAGLRGRVLRRRQRGRRVRGDRPDAEDVPPQGADARRRPGRTGRPGRTARSRRRADLARPVQRQAGVTSFAAVIQLVYVLAAACFVIGLHLMNSPATARRGNQVSTAGMVVAVIATLVLLIHDGTVTAAGWIVLIAARCSARPSACTRPGPCR